MSKARRGQFPMFPVGSRVRLAGQSEQGTVSGVTRRGEVQVRMAASRKIQRFDAAQLVLLDTHEWPPGSHLVAEKPTGGVMR